MILKLGDVYISLRDVKAVELGHVELGHDNVARLYVMFHMLPKPMKLAVELGGKLSTEEIQKARESVGKKLGELLAESRKNGNTRKVIDIKEITRVNEAGDKYGDS